MLPLSPSNSVAGLIFEVTKTSGAVNNESKFSALTLVTKNTQMKIRKVQFSKLELQFIAQKYRIIEPLAFN